MRTAFLVVSGALWLFAPACAVAQRDMGGATPIKVAVRVTSMRVAGDTVTLSYVVDNLAAPASGEDLWQFLVDTPTPAIRVDTPSIGTGWQTATKTRGEPTALWVLFADELIHPGQSSPPFTDHGIGTTDLVRYWAIPSLAAHPPVEQSETKPETSGFKQFGDSGMTVGFVPFPTDVSPTNLSSRVRRLFNYSCGPQQLIANAGICNSLRAKLDAADKSIAASDAAAARGQLGAFLNELNAQRGKFVSEAAFALLSSNAAFLLSKL